MEQPLVVLTKSNCIRSARSFLIEYRPARSSSDTALDAALDTILDATLDTAPLPIFRNRRMDAGKIPAPSLAWWGPTLPAPPPKKKRRLEMTTPVWGLGVFGVYFRISGDSRFPIYFRMQLCGEANLTIVRGLHVVVIWGGA